MGKEKEEKKLTNDDVCNGRPSTYDPTGQDQAHMVHRPGPPNVRAFLLIAFFFLFAYSIVGVSVNDCACE